MVSPIFASHSLKASFKLYDGLGQCKHLLGTLLTSLYFGYSVLNPILVTVLDRVYSGTLDLQKLLPDLTRGATITNFVFIAAGVCRLLEHVRSGGSASLRVGKAMCSTLDLHVIELLPDITTGATIGIHRFSVYMKYNILETCVSAVLKESCVTLHHLSRQLGRSRTIIWSPFRRTISPTSGNKKHIKASISYLLYCRVLTLLVGFSTVLKIKQ